MYYGDVIWECCLLLSCSLSLLIRQQIFDFDFFKDASIRMYARTHLAKQHTSEHGGCKFVCRTLGAQDD